MDFFPVICENYNQMSRNFYEQYLEATEYLSSLGCKNWDLLSHTAEENEYYITAMSQRFHSALAAVVFQALAVEAYVNLYGVMKIGETTYYQNYESQTVRKSTKDKIKKICEDTLGKSYPTNTKDYSRLCELLADRDRIVHTKPHSVKIEETTVIPQYSELMEQYDFIFKNLSEKMQSYSNLKRTLSKLDGSAEDCVQLSYRQSNEAICNELDKMICKVLCPRQKGDSQ